MKLRSIVVAVSLALASSVALANSCPREMKAIDAALPKAKLSDSQLAEVKKLRAEGEKLHKEASHGVDGNTGQARKIYSRSSPHVARVKVGRLLKRQRLDQRAEHAG